MSSLGITVLIWLEDDAGEVHHAAAEGCVPRSCRHCDHQVAAEAVREGFIARGTSVTWPPRSLDLTPPAFHLWGHVKEGTYKCEPRDLPELKTTVTECVRVVTARRCREFSQKCGVEPKSLWPEMGDTSITCSSFQEEVQTVIINDGYEFPMITEQF